MKPSNSRPFRSTSRVLTLVGLAALGAPLSAQVGVSVEQPWRFAGGTPPVLEPTWDTALNHPGDPRYVALDYITLFVANRGMHDPATLPPVGLGQDVFAASNPAPMGPGGGLYAVLPRGGVVKLFPLTHHAGMPGLIDTPLGDLGVGAVVEPNISEDGKRVYFGYFHDQTWKKSGGGWHSKEPSYKGCDLYAMELGPLIEDSGLDPRLLPIQRLTFKQYDGPAKGDVVQSVASRLDRAVNPELAAKESGEWGTVDMHLVEMRTAEGLVGVWVSDRGRLANSNTPGAVANHNFNLYVADILEDGSLGPANPFQFYTTTSALSPIPLRDGVAFSYQSSTEAYRPWDIQSLTSSGIWAPLLGYASDTKLFHLGTMVTADLGEGLVDTFLGVKYYNNNDGGFGQIHRIALADAGVNQFVPATGFAWAPQQLSTLVTLNVVAKDLPSATTIVDGEQVYYGKFSSPRAGRVGGEFLAAHTPTSANRWILDADGELNVFDSRIVYRPNVEPFDPAEPVDVAAGKGVRILVDDPNSPFDSNLIWPTPVLSWEERYGKPTQDFSPPIADPATPVLAGQPHALVGTSAIWNTDLRPYDCWLGAGEKPYDPNGIKSNEQILLDANFDSLRYVQDPDDLCAYLKPETVLGIQVNITSNRPDFDSPSNPGYVTDGGGTKESSRLLGVYAPSVENEADQSFLARIPADTPFDFHLLDSLYGMKLVDVRSWHSLKPRETRTDCGGCHQHEAGFAIPFEGTEASTRPPLDMVMGTKYVAYDANCRPRIESSTQQTLQLPEWKQDIWPGFDAYCGACHGSATSSDAAALAAFDYAGEADAYQRLADRNYASSTLGALGSPAFWAAYGERTDGRDNDLPQYQPDTANGVWGYRFSDVHAGSPGICAAADPVGAEWVRRFGQWIDSNMPRSTGDTPFDYQFDRFPPTVDLAEIHAEGVIRVGFWDDTEPLTLEVLVNGSPVWFQSGLAPGEVLLDATVLTETDVVRAVVTDPTGNRQVKERTVQQLLEE